MRGIFIKVLYSPWISPSSELWEFPLPIAEGRLGKCEQFWEWTNVDEINQSIFEVHYILLGWRIRGSQWTNPSLDNRPIVVFHCLGSEASPISMKFGDVLFQWNMSVGDQRERERERVHLKFKNLKNIKSDESWWIIERLKKLLGISWLQDNPWVCLHSQKITLTFMNKQQQISRIDHESWHNLCRVTCYLMLLVPPFFTSIYKVCRLHQQTSHREEVLHLFPHLFGHGMRDSLPTFFFEKKKGGFGSILRICWKKNGKKL